MKPRWAMFTMGVWLSGSLFVAIVATQNFYTIDRLLAGPTNASFRSLVERLGQPDTRELLRYLSSELNRLFFQFWNVAQVVLGAALLWLAARDPSARKAWWGVTAMLATVVAMIAMTPAIMSIGRSLDFVPRDPPPPQWRQFWILHGAYSALAVIQIAIGILVAVSIGRASPSHPGTERQRHSA